MSWIHAIWERLFPLVVPDYPAEQQVERVAEGVSAEDRAISGLAKEQRALADEFEQIFKTYDQRLQDTSLQLRSLRQIKDQVKLDKVKKSQSDLKLALQRLEASVKNGEQLEVELKHWQDRMAHRKSPSREIVQRLEIIRSELLVRGKTPFMPVVIQEEKQEQTASQIEPVETGPVKVVVRQRTKQTDVESGLSKSLTAPRILPETEHVLAAAREAARETNRWHAVPAYLHNEDALLQVHQLKDLNAKLKKMDKEKGVVRYRLDLAPRMSEI
ncbi:MAG: hypothetical protein RDU25_06090 [Patescibacteria group bacterium]|nr:hypothetical protein [Patescibacteria group bacterium]